MLRVTIQFMDATKLRQYVAGYDRRLATRVAKRLAQVESARACVPLLADICRMHGARSVRLFGSLVTGRLGHTPDIDLAVEGVPAEDFFDLLAELQVQVAPTEIDLVDIETASPELRRHIEAEGRDI